MMVVRTIQNLDNDTIFHHPLPMSTLRERTKTMWTLIQRIISMWGIFLWRGLICLGSSGVSHRRGWRWKLTWLCRDRIGDGVMIFGARGLCCLGCMGSQGCFHFGITGGCQSQAWDMTAYIFWVSYAFVYVRMLMMFTSCLRNIHNMCWFQFGNTILCW